MKSLDGVPDDEIRKITYENAMRIFRYDPFSVIPKEQCTVGALRAQAAGWDVSERSFGTKARGTLATNLAEHTAAAFDS
jgi:hypothetical protein